MRMAKRQEKERVAALEFNASVYTDAMFLRNGLADGHIEFKGVAYRVEVATNINGDSVLLTVCPLNAPRRTYAISTETLIRGAFEKYLAEENLT